MGQKLLVVDDDTGLCMLLSKFLRDKGYSIIMAGDGMSAIDAARREKPDLIVLDLVLPMGDGFVVMQRLKQIPAMAEIPIIAFSGLDTETNHRRALEAGANTFLKKPLKNDVLLSEIQRLLVTKATSAGKKKILVVDDDANFREVLDTFLKMAGYNIAIAVDSVTVLSIVLREKPDLILLDMGLPHEDGMAVLKKVKANSVSANIPVIVVSGKDPAVYREQSLLAGAIAYFEKPMKNQELLNTIRKTLGEA